MPKFDISNAADFNRVTQESGRNLLSLSSPVTQQLIPGLDPNQWTVQEASFRGVKFHVFRLSRALDASAALGLATGANWEGAVPKVTDIEGRRKVKTHYPYRDGQTVDDLGREGGTFTFDAVVFGDRYLLGFDALEKALQDPTPGILVHPVRGRFMCSFERGDYVHEHTARKAVTMSLTFIEHNFTIGALDSDVGFIGSIFKKSLSAVMTSFGIVDSVINKVQQSVLLGRAAKQQIALLTASWKRAIAVNTVQMNAAFNNTENSTDVPGVLPVQDGGTSSVNSALALTGDVNTDIQLLAQITASPDFSTSIAVSDPFNSVPVGLLSQETAAALAVSTIVQNVQALRVAAQAIITAIRDQPAVTAGAPGTAGTVGIPELELFDGIEQIKETMIAVQSLLEAGLASQRARIVEFTVPRIMSLREVAFINGIAPDQVQDLDALNPQLESVNYIPRGVVVKVPVQ